MKNTLVLLAIAGLTSAVQADVVTRWNFNGTSATTVPGGNLSPTPSEGAGTASLVGGVTAAPSFGSGISNGGSTDPVVTAPSNYGWQTTTYTTSVANSGTAGVQFAVSTLGYSDIIVSWDQRHSNTSSRFVQFQYSTDGTNFTAFGSAFAGNAGDTWFNNRTIDLTGVSGVDNNPNFAFRIVAVVDPASAPSAYISSSGGAFASTGTYRYDMVTVQGVVPTPGAMALIGVGGLLASRRRRA